MDRQLKKILLVLFAILIGAGIIFFAWSSGTATYTKNSQESEDGGWKNSLGVIPQTSPSKTTNSGWGGDWEKSGASSTADVVAHELLFNYALTQKNMSTTTMSDAEAQAIAQNLVDKIDTPKAKQYTEKDFNISGDNSASAIAEYIKSVASLTQAFATAQTKSDIAVVFTVPSANNTKVRLAEISQDVARYEKLVKGLIAVKTPSLLAPLHQRLVQKYANIQASIEPMAEIFTDPLKGLAGLAQYREEAAGFELLTKEYQDVISKIQQ